MAFRVGVVVCMIGMLMADVDISKLKSGQRLESVEYANGKIVTSLAEESSTKAHYTPQEPSYKITIKPKKIVGKYGTIYRYDLSHNGSLLNAVRYQNLILNTDMSDITIGLVDSRYHKLDDNFKIKAKSGRVELKDIYSQIDLMRLKYLVVLDNNGSNPDIKSITFTMPKEADSKSQKIVGAWAWRAKDIDITKIKDTKLHRIYLQMNREFEKSAIELGSKGINLFGLNGSSTDIYNYAHLKADVEKLGKLKQKYPNIIGYQLDVEPYLIPDFRAHREEIWQKYLDMLREIKKLTKKHGLVFSVVVPFWISQQYIGDTNIAHSVAKIADEIVSMSYRSDVNLVRDISADLLAIADKTETNIYLGLELMKIEDEIHTLYRVKEEESSCLSQNSTIEKCTTLEKIRKYTLRGDSISFYGQIDRLKQIDSVEIGSKYFRGYILHHLGVTLSPSADISE